MSPYIITTKHAGDPEAQARAHERIAAETGSKRALAAAEACRDGSIYVSRRAVTTLDEAWEHLRTNGFVPMDANMHDLGAPIEGGTIGPLPDGTVIEVTEGTPVVAVIEVPEDDDEPPR